MLEAERMRALLRQRFPSASPAEVAVAANAIGALADEWEEVPIITHDFQAGRCAELCRWLASQHELGFEVRLFRKRSIADE